MIYPHPSSEKGISAYSRDIIKNVDKQGLKIDGASFIQGKPLTIFKKLPLLLKYDIVHLQHEYGLLGWYGLPYFFLLAFLGIFKKKSLVVTMHTVLSQNEEFKSGKIKTFLRKKLYMLQNWLLNLVSDKIIVHAEFFGKILREEYDFKRDKITVLPHAIIEDIKTVDKSKAKKELNLSGPVYLMIGTMIPDHGHDIIIRQANKIGKTILVATNPSPINYKNESKIKNFLELNKKITRENHFEKIVRFDIGEISYEKWWKYFIASDLVLLPYRGGIGSGIFADAMAVKKPVIGSNVKYFKEFSQNYGCIKLAEKNEDFSNVIKQAMKPENYKKMVKECERYFKENGLTPVSKKYKSLYQSLIH